ncbi:hypothetical protein EV210_12323 [Anaerospora hongkongensis]|uniref:Tyr recombinase domain-containing protein n=1 Tax=Anaerospora hongkongensis TaxID=244830 RepID=A0A4R1PLX7_9FIRM|nr:hypothetical protein [Anaerospora hongkongensis]TCL32203.1 hypothetical protein EV210_12323 [Anaerospora hongkongensis]
MNGKIGEQVEDLFNRTGIMGLGESKHDDKGAARDKGASGWDELGKQTKIHSIQQKENLTSTWKDFGNFCADKQACEKYGVKSVKDYEKVKPEHFEAFIKFKIDEGRMRSTVYQYVSRLEKLEYAVNVYITRREIDPKMQNQESKAQALDKVRAEYREAHKNDKQPNLPRNFSTALENCRQAINKSYEKTGEVVNRKYIDVPGIINNLKKDDYKTAAELQGFGGARVKEISNLTAKNLVDREGNPLPPGQIRLTNTKGGRPRTITVPLDTWYKVKEAIENKGAFKISERSYSNALRKAVEKNGEKFNGTHGLRWSFVDRKFNELSEGEKNVHKIFAKLSRFTGHTRSSISKRYKSGYTQYAKKKK